MFISMCESVSRTITFLSKRLEYPGAVSSRALKLLHGENLLVLHRNHDLKADVGRAEPPLSQMGSSFSLGVFNWI